MPQKCYVTKVNDNAWRIYDGETYGPERFADSDEAVIAIVKLVASQGGRVEMIQHGNERSFFLQVIDQGAFLVVMYDRRCSLGLVRLRARRLVEDAKPWLAGMRRESMVLDEIGDDEIDALFADCSAP